VNEPDDTQPDIALGLVITADAEVTHADGTTE
jgi:hypothetical protein